VTSAFSPTSGQGGAGNTLTFDVGPVDTQGVVICQPVFLNGASAPVSAPATPAGCPTGGLGDVGTATGQSTGTLHVSIPITALTTPGPNFVYLAWDPAGSPQQLVVPYTISALATNCGPILGSGTSDTGPQLPAAPPSTSFTALSTSCTASEVIHQQVIGTASGLSQATQQTGSNPAPPDVNMTNVTLNGFQQTSTGALNTDVVQDIRGTLVGWTVSAVFQDDLQGPSIGLHHTIPVSGFNWTPAKALNVASPPSGFLSDVTAGAATASGFDKSVANGGGGTARTLCFALPGGGGGTFNCSAGLTLVVPAGVAAGAYSAVLQITIT
jgi:hypothetical protein